MRLHKRSRAPALQTLAALHRPGHACENDWAGDSFHAWWQREAFRRWKLKQALAQAKVHSKQPPVSTCRACDGVLVSWGSCRSVLPGNQAGRSAHRAQNPREARAHSWGDLCCHSAPCHHQTPLRAARCPRPFRGLSRYFPLSAARTLKDAAGRFFN
jgi:hypothetical protein